MPDKPVYAILTNSKAENVNANSVNIAVVDGKTITQTVDLGAAKTGLPVRIKAVQGGKYIIGEGEKGFAPENLTIKRVGKNLHIALEGTDPDQAQLIIENFEGSGGQLVGLAEDGSYYEYISSDADQDGAAAFLYDGAESAQVLGAQPLAGFGNGLVAGAGIGWFWPALLGLGALGLLGGVYAATRNKDDNNDPTTPVGGGNGDKGSLGGVTDDVGDKQGLIGPGESTDDKTPTFTGIGRPGTTVEIVDNGKVIGTAPVGDDGKWEFTPAEPGLADGSHNIVIVPVDAGGNKGEPSPGHIIIVDTVAPAAPLIDGVYDDTAPNEGLLASGDSTNDTTPTLKGTAEAGAIVHIYDNGEPIGTALADEHGNWEFTPKTELAEGAHEFTIAAEDAAGNISVPSLPFPIVIDITAPEKPGPGKGGIDDIFDNVGPVQGSIGDGDSTDDNTPTFTGSGATPGDTVIIIDNGKIIGTVPVDEGGNWEFTPNPALDTGPHEVVVVIEDPAGNKSEPSDPITVIIVEDTTPPVKPTPGAGGIEIITDDVGPITGIIADGDSTDDNAPTFGGSGAVPGDIVTIIDNGEPIGSVVVGDDGKWEFTPETGKELAEGSHEIVVVIEDPWGNPSEPSDPITIIVDTQAPVTPTLGAVIDNEGDSTGNLNPGDVTDDARPELTGTAEPGSVVTIYDNGAILDSVTAGADGSWSFTPQLPLSNGPHSFTVTSTDSVGNVSLPTPAFDLQIVAGGSPSAPAITGVVDDQGSIQGNVSKDATTDDNLPTITGTGTTGDTILIYNGDQLLGTAKVENGQWEFTPETALVDGTYNLTAQAKSPADNLSPATGVYTIIVDTSAPTAPTQQQLIDDVGAVTGPIPSGATTDDSNPTFVGMAEPGSVVMIYDNGALLDSRTADSDGNWSFTPTTALENGPHSLTAQAVDAAGNVGPMGPAMTFIVDATAVEISITSVVDDAGFYKGPLESGESTDDTTPTLNGQATPGATVNIYNGTTLVDSVVADPVTGAWSFTMPELAPGTHNLTATVTTPASGESAPTPAFTVIVDTTAPTAPVIGAVTDDVGTIQGPIGNGQSTDDNTPTLSGEGLEPGDTVEIYDNGELLGTEKVDENGHWSFTPSPSLNDGSHSLTVITRDPAGNPSAPSDPWIVIVDTDAPVASAVVQSMSKDSGADREDFLTNDGSAGRLIQGSLTAALVVGDKVQVSTDGGTTWLDALVNADNTWNFVDQNSHTGNWTIQTRVVDAAGNSNSSSQAVTLDSAGPNAPSELVVGNESVEVSIFGSGAVAGDMITVLWGDHAVNHELSATDIAMGSVTVVIPSDIIALVPIPASVHAGVVDAAGNPSDYRKLDSLYDFEGVPLQSMPAAGSSVDLGPFTATRLDNTVPSPSNSNGVVKSNNYGDVALAMTGSWLFDLKGDSASAIELNVSDSQANNIIIFYDAAGTPILSTTMSPATGIASFSFTMPGNTEFSTFEIRTLQVPTQFDYIEIHDVKLIGLGGSVVVPPLATQSVVSGIYYGGDEENVFTIGDANYFDDADSGINGGSGIDTLKLMGGNQTLDLTINAEKLTSVEIIDITGTGNNTLNLSLGDVLEQGAASLFTADDTVQMMIKGNAGDVVKLDDLLPDGTDPGDWAASGTTTVAGVVYNVFQHSSLDAELLVQSGVTTNLV
ncbi:Ig-like domain-containing protein [Pseudomonas sp. P7548]|uniref:Ig-like domain-containing protein n=1 Tax=Pseudomonas sp. P7548 TaxID=2726981 RepID=UPI0015BCE26E|nr:Ig-like domain-containing protein [Pseudomonas sp. P7548]NWE20686.1 Biofilm associated protein A [Pseudomonas sp. P7548]